MSQPKIQPSLINFENGLTVSGGVLFANAGFAIGSTLSMDTVGNIGLRHSAPTIFFRDTDNRSGILHCNNGYMYILNTAGNDSDAQQLPAGRTRWGFEHELSTGKTYFGNNIDVDGSVVATSATINGTLSATTFTTPSGPLSFTSNVKIQPGRLQVYDSDNISGVGIIELGDSSHYLMYNAGSGGYSLGGLSGNLVTSESFSVNFPSYNNGAGYQVFSNGFKMQWGAMQLSSSGYTDVSFPISFSSIGYIVQANSPDATNIYSYQISASQFRVGISGDTAPRRIFWSAMGY